MSVQWWVEGKRVSFREAMEARARGKCPSATVDATDGWPEIGWPEIVAHVENDGHVAIEAMDLQIFRLPGMFRADALLRDIDAVRGFECAYRTSDKASGPPPAVAGDSAATPLLSTTPAYYLLPEGATRLWELIDALGMSHRQASAFEYVYRAGRKPGASKADDLRKAVANLEYEIARLESEGDDT
jgi:hypothetical protein